MNKIDKIYLTRRFIIRCICYVIVFIAGIIFAYTILQPFWISILQDRIVFDVNDLSFNERSFLNSLIAANKIHTAEFAFDRIVHFYESLITIIIGLSAFLGICGYLYIKNSHQRDIEEGIYVFCNSKRGETVLKEHIQAIAQAFFKESFNRSLNEDVLKDIVINNAQNTEDIEAILNRLEILEENANSRGIKDIGKINIPNDESYT